MINCRIMYLHIENHQCYREDNTDMTSQWQKISCHLHPVDDTDCQREMREDRSHTSSHNCYKQTGWNVLHRLSHVFGQLRSMGEHHNLYPLWAALWMVYGCWCHHIWPWWLKVAVLIFAENGEFWCKSCFLVHHLCVLLIKKEHTISRMRALIENIISIYWPFFKRSIKF